MAALFQLKQFAIHQEHSAHKVGTDGMLLAAYLAQHLSLLPPATVLDVGTGTGIIALMLAQTFRHCHITGIELDHLSALEAVQNAEQSPFAGRVSILEGNYLQYSPTKHFDLITSNPPYYTPTHQNKEQRETHAKHAITLPPLRFFEKSKELLAPRGTVATIIAISALPTFQQAATKSGFAPLHRLTIYTKSGQPAKRIITLWQQDPTDYQESHLTLLAGEGRHNYTPHYAQLLQPYLTIL